MQKSYKFSVFAPTTLDENVTIAGGKFFKWRVSGKWDLKSILNLWNLLRTNRVDLLHIHDPRAGVIGRLVAKSLGIPVIYTVHLPPYYYVSGLKRGFYRYVERFLNYHFTERIIYVSQRVYREAIGQKITPFDRTMVIENGVDLELYATPLDRHKVRNTMNTPDDLPVICFIGRLTEQKGLDVLLLAVRALIDQALHLRVWLVGDGPLRSQLEGQTLKLGLSDVVQFLGFRDDVPSLLRSSDVFALPSRYEAMPIVLLEAMAAGLPSVVTDVGDNAELVEDGVSGITVPPENPEALAEALKRLLLDPALRSTMGKKAKSRVQHYTIERMVARTQEVYDEVLKQ